MVFSSTLFLFLFLPSVLLGYLLAGRKLRNSLLLFASLVFYAWGENIFILLMLISIGMNYFFGLLVDFFQCRGYRGRIFLIVAICFNLGLLGFFKYANFFVANVNIIFVNLGFPPLDFDTVHLPIGISFFTFQALSYVIDIYRKEAVVQKNPVNIALYISLFPQLIAGPIVRYHDVATQIEKRKERFEDFYYGIQRFIVGLSKKVLLANVLGRTVDHIFSLPPEAIPLTLAWLGAVSYTLQIYYDFSGYSDMAIGLGRMFGFHFLENFNYPYISRSIREFWQRWHISLSTWFRDYVYIPLGGNRYGSVKTYRNLLLIFLLCGFWHGANWTFLFWGIYHGCFLIVERLYWGKKILNWLPSIIQHLYVFLVVIVGWVFFRAETIDYAFGYLFAMIDWTTPPLFNSQIFININNEFYFVLVLSLILMVPLASVIKQKKKQKYLLIRAIETFPLIKNSFCCVKCLGLVFLFLYSVANILRGAYNPFLYFRF